MLFSSAIMALLVAQSHQFRSSRSGGLQRRTNHNCRRFDTTVLRRPLIQISDRIRLSAASSTDTDGVLIPPTSTTTATTTTTGSSSDLNANLRRLVDQNNYFDAIVLLNESEKAMVEGLDGQSTNDVTASLPNHDSYSFLLVRLAAADDTLDQDERLSVVDDVWSRLQYMAKHNVINKDGRFTPTRVEYNAVLLAWSKSFHPNSGERCDTLLKEMWAQYYASCGNDNDDVTERNARAQDRNPFCPSLSSYITTMTALARSAWGKRAAERTEELLEEMEQLSRSRTTTESGEIAPQFPHLKPTTVCVNIVLSAWGKSGAREALQRCEVILDRMEQLYMSGRTELQPNTVSFNTVLDALAQSKERGSEQRAELLLQRMAQFSGRDGLAESCLPDRYSFNSVLNGWARSRDPSAAARADSILEHMEKRYASGMSDLKPDVLSYNTVLSAWARSRQCKNNKSVAVHNALQLLTRMEKSYARGNSDAGPNTRSYNIVINALANSRESNAPERALEILKKMNRMDSEEGREICRPDCVTYTTIINVLAKKRSGQSEAAETAIKLLEELERLYMESDDLAFKPNIRTYTSVVHAISRSRTKPERAEDIVNRLETLYESGDIDVQPDCVCYDALINAFGWSDAKDRSLKCFAIYEKMLKLFQDGTNRLAKPDIITCNSVLNACAHETVATEEEKAAIMNVAVRTLEDFQSCAPRFGFPNHISYANTLQAICQHVEDEGKRADLAETTFWQCCRNGHVSVLVVTSLHRALDSASSWPRLKSLLGDALQSGENQPLHFNFKLLPQGWTRFAPDPNQRRNSRPSQQWGRNASAKQPSTVRLGGGKHSKGRPR